MKLLAKLKSIQSNSSSDQSNNKILFPNLSKTLINHELNEIQISKRDQLVHYVKSMEFNHDRTLLAISSYHGFVRLFKIDDNDLKSIYSYQTEPQSPVRCMKFINNQLKFLVCGTDAGNIHVIDYENNLEIARLPFGEFVRCLMVHPKYPFFMAGGDNGKIIMWNWEKNFIVEHVMSKPSLDTKKYVMSMSMNCFNNDIVISGSLDGNATVWNIPFRELSEYKENPADKNAIFKISNKPKPIGKKIKMKSPINCVDCYRGHDFNRRNWFVASFDDGSTQIFDSETEEFIVKLSQIHPEPVTTCVFEGDFILAGSEDGKVDIYYSSAGFKLNRRINSNPKMWAIQVDKSVSNHEKLKNETQLKIAIGGTNTCTFYSLKKMFQEYPPLKINQNPRFLDVEIVTRASDVLIIGSFEYYMKLSETDPQAQYRIGIMLKNGQDVLQDQREGLQWLLRSAKNGNSLAQFEVGMYFLNTDKNLERAHKWLLKAATNGHDEAQYQMARLFTEGIWVMKDFTQAFNWAFKAAQQKHSMAVHYIIDCYNYGTGVKRNLVEAKLWMESVNQSKLKRFKNAFETFGIDSNEILQPIISYSSRPIILKLYEKDFYLNENSARKCKYISKKFLEECKDSLNGLKLVDLSNLLMAGKFEKITDETLEFYLHFLQSNTITVPPQNNYYQILVPLYELAAHLENKPCIDKILQASNPILRCFFLDKMNCMNSTFNDILHCYIVNEDLKALQLPFYLVEYLMNGKNIELFAKWKLLNSGYQHESPVNEMKIDGTQLLSKYCFNTNKLESFACVPVFLSIQHKNGEVIISNIISNMRVFIEFIGLENVGYHISMSNANETVKLTPLIEYFEIRGVLSFADYVE